MDLNPGLACCKTTVVANTQLYCSKKNEWMDGWTEKNPGLQEGWRLLQPSCRRRERVQTEWDASVLQGKVDKAIISAAKLCFTAVV